LSVFNSKNRFTTYLKNRSGGFIREDLKNRGPIGQHAKDSHGYFTFPKLEGDIGTRMMFRGKERLIWSLNNYLGLANHPEVRKTDAEAAAKYGYASPMGARMMSGNTNYHEQLENELSEFMGKEDTILLNFGYQEWYRQSTAW
jgi:glycine C-acetyltransferase